MSESIPPVPPVPPPPAEVPLPPPPAAPPPAAPPPATPLASGEPPLLPPLERPAARPPSGPPRPVPGLRGLWLLAGGVVTAVFIVGGALQFATALSLHELDQSVSFARVNRVVVDVDAGSVEVRGGERDAIAVGRHVSRGFGEPSVEESVSGDTLFLRSRCRHLIANWCSVSYTLDVPRSITIEARSRAGHVSVTGIDGDVQAESDAGRVVATDTAGRLRLSSQAGRIEGSGLRSPEVDAETQAGRVTLAFVAAPLQVTAQSSAGNVTVTVPDDGEVYRVKADSAIAEVVVAVPTDDRAPRRIDASTSAGAVSVAPANS